MQRQQVPGSGLDVTRRAASRKPRPGMAGQIVSSAGSAWRVDWRVDGRVRAGI
jgi:hypothetical protein